MAVKTNKGTCTYTLLGVSLSIDSNIVNFDVVGNVVTLTKAMSPAAGKPGDTITVTFTLLATAAILNTVLTDDLPTLGFTFVPGSVKIDGVSVPAANPVTGINIGGVGLNVTKTIEFQCTVN